MGIGELESGSGGPAGEPATRPVSGGRIRAVPLVTDDLVVRPPGVGSPTRRRDGVGAVQQTSDDVFSDGSGRPRVLRGVAIYSAASVLAELAARTGFDTVWVEMEHGAADFQEAQALCMAIEAGGGLPTIRLPDAQRTHVLRALEVGARIVVVPMVNTAEQAVQIVTAGKFPPLGSRGYNTRSRGLGYGLTGCLESFAAANRRTYLFAQIETMTAVSNLDAICAVDGLAGIFIGPGDLSVSAGHPGDLNCAPMIELVTGCIRRARTAGRHAGILVGPGPLLDAAMAAGCDLAFCGGDVMDLAGAWQKLLATFNARAAGPAR
jgi:2-keto-3-deoxy-L-rhamnonate aldolase RhmA